MTFVVFPAGPMDDEDLARVHVTTWRETYRGLLPDAFLKSMSETVHARRFRRTLIRRDSPEVVLAAADPGGLIGYAQAMPSRHARPGEAEIATLYVLRARQRMGVGEALLRAGARAMAARGATSLVISVLRDNLPARNFYEHLGGRADAPRPEPGPGGVLYEVAYRWPDITALI
ncbi:GNAT family N-acetyltransferase [Phenylobacterium sp.]|uniref:GNAT family N-acetyltransferase n=1 Tax=Phenylobacterium sp. TaxID=1871053 RepID=UPI0035B4F31F